MAPDVHVSAVTPQRISVDTLPDPTDPVTVVAYYFYLDGVKVTEYPVKNTQAEAQRQASNSPRWLPDTGDTPDRHRSVNASGIESPQSEAADGDHAELRRLQRRGTCRMPTRPRSTKSSLTAGIGGLTISGHRPAWHLHPALRHQTARALTPDDHFRWGAISGTLVANGDPAADRRRTPQPARPGEPT